MSLGPNVPQSDIEKIQAAINDTFPGLTVFVRDVNLEDRISARYEKDLIVREKGFVDASCRIQGMVTTHRYIILSNHMVDLSGAEHGTNWGLCVAQRDSHFKVLGVHRYQGKTAIVLLHLPDDERWTLFKHVHINIEDEVYNNVVGSFEKKCLLPPVPELATPQWLDRCTFPVGVDDNGTLWPL